MYFEIFIENDLSLFVFILLKLILSNVLDIFFERFGFIFIELKVLIVCCICFLILVCELDSFCLVCSVFCLVLIF